MVARNPDREEQRIEPPSRMAGHVDVSVLVPHGDVERLVESIR